MLTGSHWHEYAKGQRYEGLGFAIPTNEFLPIVEELIEKALW